MIAWRVWSILADGFKGISNELGELGNAEKRIQNSKRSLKHIIQEKKERNKEKRKLSHKGTAGGLH